MPTSSASVDDLVTIFCLLDLKYTGACPMNMTVPVTDLPSSYVPNDESTYDRTDIASPILSSNYCDTDLLIYPNIL